jgi:mannosyltransferase
VAERSDARRTTALWAAGVALLGVVVGAAGSWIPAAWADEAATMSGVRRSVPELWHMAHNVDGVHSFYYLLLHLWFDVVPYSPFWLRLPSSLATGLAAGLLVLLVHRLAGLRPAVAAGIVFCLLPRVTFSAIEGRSNALTAAAAVGLTLLLVVAVARTTEHRRTAWVWWAAYTAVAIAGSVLFVYVALILVAHAVTLVLWQLRRLGRGDAPSMIRPALWWLGAAVVTGAALLPFLRTVSGQTAQLYWMGPLVLDAGLARRVFVDQWFLGTGTFVWIPFALMTVGIVATLAVPRLRTMVPAIEVALPVVVLPTVIVVAVSILVRPFYDPRYFTFCTPFVAVLLGLVLTSLPWRTVTAVALVAVAALVSPTYLAQRTPTAKDDSTWNVAAALITAERAKEPAGTVDAVYYGPLPSHTNRTTEFVASSYPDAFAGMRDLTRKRSAIAIGQLWAERSTTAEPLPSTAGVDRVWFVGEATPDQPRIPEEQLAAQGWHVQQQWQESAFTIIVFAKE